MLIGFQDKKTTHFAISTDDHGAGTSTSLNDEAENNNNIVSNNFEQRTKKPRKQVMNEMRLNQTIDTPARKRQGSYSAVRNALNSLYRVDDFDMLEFIDQGFYSDVYKVKHRASGEIMVMKINKDVTESASDTRTRYKAAVRKEALLMTQLSHHNVLRFKGVCVDHTVGKWQLHALTEYCNGGSVQKFILTHLKGDMCLPPLKDRVRMSADIASGMGYLNSKMIMHRDLTPMNILLKQCGFFTRCVIADFGLACTIPEDEGSALMQVGTPLWMAPECLKEEFYAAKADVFSFGIILCQLISMIDADPDQGFPRTPIYGLDYAKFVEKCAPSDTPLQLLELAFNCCLMNPESRPNFDECYKRLLQIQRNSTTQNHNTQPRRLAKKLNMEGQLGSEIGLSRSSSDIGYLLKRSTSAEKEVDDKIAPPQCSVALDDVTLLSRAEALKMAKKMATLDPSYELSIVVSNPFRKYLGGGRALLSRSRNNAERHRAATNPLATPTDTPDKKGKEGSLSVSVDKRYRAFSNIDNLVRWQRENPQVMNASDADDSILAGEHMTRRSSSLPASPVSSRRSTDNYTSIDTLALATGRDLQLKEQLSKKFRESDAQFADAKKQAMKRHMMSPIVGRQHSSTPLDKTAPRPSLALSPISPDSPSITLPPMSSTCSLSIEDLRVTQSRISKAKEAPTFISDGQETHQNSKVQNRCIIL